ncbi:MAG: type II secretion system F family protein [Candidatus Eisenbacteria bacterium]
MTVYTYEAVDSRGRKVKSEIEAVSSQDAINRVHKLGYFPTNVKEKTAAVTGGTVRGPGRKNIGFVLGGVSTKQITQFTTQLSILQDAGLPIVRSLKVLEGQMKPCLLKGILAQVTEDVEGGSSLSEAMARHPKAFDKLYVNMIKAGEAGGVLDTILQRLAQFLEKAQALKRKIIGAAIYPVAVMTVAVGIVAGIMVFVIPSFKKVFADLGHTLPAATSILLDLSEMIAAFWYLIPAFPLLCLTVFRMMGRTTGGRLLVDKMKLQLPLFGNIMRKAVISRFARTLGTLISSGVPILEALAVVKNAIGNEVVANAVQDVHDSIREGESIAEPLAATGVFDDIVINMIDVGEETGELDKMLAKIANNYDAEVDVAVGAFMSILEPVMIVGLGATVGFIVIALFLPLIRIVEQVGS